MHIVDYFEKLIIKASIKQFTNFLVLVKKVKEVLRITYLNFSKKTCFTTCNNCTKEKRGNIHCSNGFVSM